MALAAATLAPWAIKWRDGRGGALVLGACEEPDGRRVVVSEWCDAADAALLVGARNAWLAALVAEVRRLREANETREIERRNDEARRARAVSLAQREEEERRDVGR